MKLGAAMLDPRRYAVTVMDAFTPMRLFWTRDGALRWRDSIGAHAHAFRWDGYNWLKMYRETEA